MTSTTPRRSSEPFESHVPDIQYRQRWFCYLDLLGFSQLVRSQSITRVLPLYERVLGRVERAVKKRKSSGIGYSWFSDTFIIFSHSNSAEDFAQLEQASRLFFQALVLDDIPVRGAVSCGALYTQQKRNVFIGEALIDAHSYGEAQDWLGFLLTPSAVRRMAEVGLPVSDRPFYKQVPHGIMRLPSWEPVYAFAFNNQGGSSSDGSSYLRALQRMRQAALLNDAPPSAVTKYDRSIAFLRASQLSWQRRDPDTAA